MRFVETPISGCLIVEAEPHEDSRGLFARMWCAREFADAKLPSVFVQSSVSRNSNVATIRGMHYQLPPSREGKLVRCVRGGIFDAVVDIRHTSSTFLTSFTVDLTAKNLKALYIPPGCAHGFQTIADETDVLYQMTDYHAPELSDGFRWNDPAVDIAWPLPVSLISTRDREYSDLDESRLRDLSWSTGVEQ
jgi:dTDP-4-dehydrorhamnose 3,5-epimerase